jgi:hypothetical protein
MGVVISLNVPSGMMQITDKKRKDVSNVGKYDKTIDRRKRDRTCRPVWRGNVPN